MSVSTENSGQLRGKTIAVLGAGKMGSLILRSLIDSGAVDRNHLRGTVKHNEHAHELRESLQISVGTSNLDAARDADVVILCVKPSGVSKVAEAIRPVLSAKVLVISIATGVTTEGIEAVVGPGVPVIRAMPNTPCRIGRGMTALCAGRMLPAVAYRDRRGHFSLMGKTAEVDEIHMDAVTGLSASGPAFIYIVLEALAEGGGPRRTAARDGNQFSRRMPRSAQLRWC